MRVLIACEESQTVCKAFRKLGHEAYSCDIQESSGGNPEWHMQMDMFKAYEILKPEMVIAHPPCTFLTTSGLRWLYADKTKSAPHPKFPNRLQDQKDAIEFVKRIYELPCSKIAIENPVGVLSSQFMKPTQIIQPFHFGENASKKTCLWLKGLPNLIPTEIVECEYKVTSSGKRFDVWYWNTSMLKGEERRKARSKTFQGIAEAMASQGGNIIS